MSIASVGSFGTGGSTAPGTTLLFPAVLSAGSVGILAIALDNTATTDGTTSEITSITDTGGNTYSFLGAFRNAQGGAAAGSQIEIWLVKCTTALTLGDEVTITLANTVTAKSVSAWEFTVGAGNTLELAASATLANDGAAVGSLGVSGLSSLERLFFRATASERRSCAWEVTSTVPTTPVLDDFNRADEGPPPSSSWTTRDGTGWKVASNTVIPDNYTVEQSTTWNTSFGADQEVYATISGVATTNNSMVFFNIRQQALTDPATDRYQVVFVRWTPNDFALIQKKVSGSWTPVGAAFNLSGHLAIGDQLGVRVAGSTLQVFRNGGLIATRTDSAITGAGFITLGTSPGTAPYWAMDDFGGGVSAAVVEITQGQADSGVNGTSMAVNGEFLIATVTGATSSPQGTNSADHASIIVALEEVAVASEALATLSKTLDAISIAATSTVAVQGSLTKTLSAITLGATATVEVQGALSKTIDAIALIATAVGETWGVLTKTIGDIALIASGVVTDAGTTGELSKTLDAFTLAATATIEVQGVLAKTLDQILVSATSSTGIQGTLAKTLGDFTLSAAAGVENKGTLSATLDSFGLEATAEGLDANSGFLNKILDDFALVATALVDTEVWIDAESPEATSWRSSYLHDVAAYGGVEPMGSGSFGGTTWTADDEHPVAWVDTGL